MTDRILLFGASGQLGRALLSAGPPDVVIAPRSVDIADAQAVLECTKQATPTWIVNAAAMTDVDGAHVRPELAMAINTLGPGNLARAADSVGARMVHVSTEAVFDGESTRSYTEDDVCHPVSVYGASKLAGEHLVSIFSPESYILRTSWLYSGATGTNFPTRILEQLRDPGRVISVVTDIVGNPTTTSLLAEAIMALMGRPPAPGTYHVCCRDAASKFDWAVEIAEVGGHDPGRITPVTSAEYPTVALRPKHVDLDCTKFADTGLIRLPTWREAWRDVLADRG
ncbi:MAG: dTDP-4-dehydrorhamnose reductase [Actinomycetota bacterium]|nr:dTDP-4-dehydrorhamnose reductase [Actinomycetota bacterium]